jgi:hypothetical protein
MLSTDSKTARRRGAREQEVLELNSNLCGINETKSVQVQQ